MAKAKLRAKTANPQLASLILRIGLAAVFVYAALDAFKEPNAWISYVPAFSTKFIAAKISLDLISLSQLALALWLLTGRYLKYAAAISAVLLAGIVIFNLNTLLITFRDFGLVAAAIALIFLDD